MLTLWCRRPDCGIGYASVGGDVPTICPGCLQDALWTTFAPLQASVPPRVAWTLNYNDRKFLNTLRIAGDGE